MVNLQIVMLSASTSLASIMVIGLYHAAVTHVGDSSEVGQREHMVRQGFTRKCWSEFLCLGDYPAAPSWGVCPAGCDRQTHLRRPPPLAYRRRARGRSPIGYIHMLAMCDLHLWRSHLVNDNIAGYRIHTRAVEYRPTCASVCVRDEVEATGHNLRSALPRTTRMAMDSSNGRS
jgi:hypothetical protein